MKNLKNVGKRGHCYRVGERRKTILLRVTSLHGRDSRASLAVASLAESASKTPTATFATILRSPRYSLSLPLSKNEKIPHSKLWVYELLTITFLSS